MQFDLKIAHLISEQLQQNKKEGFTLIELLVVIIIIGILSAVSLPNLIAEVGKSREAEAKINLGSLNRSKQAYFVEKATFANTIDELGLTFDQRYYNFPNPDLVSSTVVKHRANSLDSGANSTRDYEMGIYYNLGEFNVLLCQSISIDGTVEVPSTITNVCNSGIAIQ